MTIGIKWMGIDFGLTLMDTSRQRSYWMIGDISKELGQPELVEERCHKWRIMKEKYGSWSEIKENHKPEVVTYVFSNHPAAAEVFNRMDHKYMSLANGAADAIKDLRNQGIEISIVAELKKTLGPITKESVLGFLRSRGIIHYFDELITPQGKVNLRSNEVDLSYVGKSKEEGALYDLLVKDLAKKNIKSFEAAMVGDKEWTDIQPAKERGFRTILYTGYIRRGPTEADFVVSHFSELKNLVALKK